LNAVKIVEYLVQENVIDSADLLSFMNEIKLGDYLYNENDYNQRMENQMDEMPEIVTEPIKIKYIKIPIPGYPGFYADSDGYIWGFQVKRNTGWHRLCSSPTTYGYLLVHVYYNGKRKTVQVHQLVALAFHGPCPLGKQVRHYPDPDKNNNRPENLKYGTPKENAADSIEQGLSPRGIKNCKAKLDDILAMEVYNRAITGENQRFIARDYGISISTVSSIKDKITWPHIHKTN